MSARHFVTIFLLPESLQTQSLSTFLHTEICMVAVQEKLLSAWIWLICHDNCGRVLINPLGILLRMKATHCQGGVCCSALYSQPLKMTRGSVAGGFGLQRRLLS